MPVKSPTCPGLILLLCWGVAACSKHEEPLPPSAARVSAPSASEPVRAPVARPRASPSPPATPTAGADLERVALDSAAFSDMVDSLRKFAGKEIEFNADTLDLESFVQGKSAQELLTFAEETQFKSPYAALQVLGYLWHQDLDIRLRVAVAGPFGELACAFGYEKDRALAYECMDWLIDVWGDPGQAAALTNAERREILNTYHNLTITFAVDASAVCKKQADALRRTARSDLERAEADEFDAFALLNTGQLENIPAARAKMESLRARSDAEFSWVNHWLSLDDAAIAAEFGKMRDIDAQFRLDEQRRFQRQESLSPAERLTEVRRMNQAEEQP